MPKSTVLFSLLSLSLLSACAETTPSKSNPTKSMQQIADEAMKSKGKLSPEQIKALIAANSACYPGQGRHQ